MEFLRKSWKWVLGVIGFFIGLVWMFNANSSRKVKKIKKNIIKNKKPKIKKKTVKQATNSIKNRLKKK